MSKIEGARPATRPIRKHQRGGARSARPDTGPVSLRRLGRYPTEGGGCREIVACPGVRGTILVIDRDALGRGGHRLVAHLGADEPLANAELICRLYLADAGGRWCRRLRREDLRREPLTPGGRPTPAATVLRDERDFGYALEPVRRGDGMFEVRWLRRPPRACAGPPQLVSLRRVVGELEDYEPACGMTATATVGDLGVGRTVLRAELERLRRSRIVLNRGLRLAVQAELVRGEVSMSEIACRCGRVKRDRRGCISGETSWLARRIGMAPEGGSTRPTPWIHTEVLALVARAGLGISPREVEL